MNVSRARKEKQVQELSESFQQYNCFYLLDFVNMPVSQSFELRRKMRENSHSFKIVKNRLALQALREDFPSELRDYFRGPTGIAYASDDPIGLARLLRDFSAQYKLLNVKAGLVEGKFLSRERFEEIANLTSKKDLLAKIGYFLAYPLTRLLRTWQAPLMNAGSLLSQLKSKK